MQTPWDATTFRAKGYAVLDGFVDDATCARLLDAVAAYRESHDVVRVHRPSRERPLRYSVIDGLAIRDHLPEIHDLHLRVNEVVNALTGQRLDPLEDAKVACNVNITEPGGSYRWHYDRNACTALLYLNAVEGGETDCYPDFRLFLPFARWSPLQRWSDALVQLAPVRRAFGRLVTVVPAPGTLFVMRGNRALHSVRPLTGGPDRINVVMSYDVPGQRYDVADQLDTYLYTAAATDGTASGDPNYR